MASARLSEFEKLDAESRKFPRKIESEDGIPKSIRRFMKPGFPGGQLLVGSPGSPPMTGACPERRDIKTIQALSEYCMHHVSEYAFACGKFTENMHKIRDDGGDEFEVLLDDFREIVGLFCKIADVEPIREYLVQSGAIPSCFHVTGLLRVRVTPTSLYNELLLMLI